MGPSAKGKDTPNIGRLHRAEQGASGDAQENHPDYLA